MSRNSQKKNFGMLFGIIALLIVALIVAVVKMGGSSVDTTQPLQVANTVQCPKDFTKDVNFVTRNSFDKGVSVDNVTYSVWKNVDGLKVPQPNADGKLTVGYGESYEVVAMADGYKYELATFSVDDKCNGPADKVFYLTQLPTSVDATFENSKITGPNSDVNRVPIEAEVTRNVKATFNGVSKTSTDAIIVIDADKNQFTIDSTLASAPQPEEHTTLTGYKSYTFDLGTFDGSADLLANFDITGDVDLTAGDYNISYTIYQYQSGYVDSKSGEFVNEPAVEHDGTVLLPTFTGSIFMTVQ